MTNDFKRQLKALDSNGLMRSVLNRRGPQGRTVQFEINERVRDYLNFASNDYLGLSTNAELKQEAQSATALLGTGAGAARLLGGGTELTRDLEDITSALKGSESALVFGSGYAANTGMIPALTGEGDEIFSDELNHASIIDGCRLSRAKVTIYQNRDMDQLESALKNSDAAHKLIVTDSVFSMDGTLAPLIDINNLCKEHGAMLYLDDAHATGVLGEGHGALAHRGLRAEEHIVQMGTYSKALGSLGGYVCAPENIIKWAINSSRSFIFSTALPPGVVAANLRAVRMIMSDKTLIEKLWKNRELLHSALTRLGLDTAQSQTPIIPVIMNSVDEAVRLSRHLMDKGIYAPAIKPPTVKRARLRLTITAGHTPDDIDQLSEALKTSI